VSKEIPNPPGGGNGRVPPAKRDASGGDDVRVGRNTSGRVKFDDRGNAIWEWALKTGVFGLEASTSRLKKLEHPALSLEEDTPPPSPLVKPNPKGVAQGYSPYDSGVLAKSKSGPPPPRKKDLRRLSEWFQLRKQASDNKDDDE
jgi:hypothetical protein